SSSHARAERDCLGEEVSNEPLDRSKEIGLLAPCDVPMVPLGVMIVIHKSRFLLSGANERKPITDAFRMADIALNFPDDDLDEISVPIRPFPPPEQLRSRHSSSHYMAAYTTYRPLPIELAPETVLGF